MKGVFNRRILAMLSAVVVAFSSSGITAMAAPDTEPGFLQSSDLGEETDYEVTDESSEEDLLEEELIDEPSEEAEEEASDEASEELSDDESESPAEELLDEEDDLLEEAAQESSEEEPADDASFEAETSGDFEYTVSSGKATISKYKGTTATKVTIPDTIEGNTVVKIGYSAFSGHKELTSVSLPDTITEISGYAFQNCTGLTSFEFPKSLTTIGYDCFYGCKGITEITIPAGITSVGSDAFPYVTKAVFESGIEAIPSNCFNGASALTSVVFPGSVTKIGSYAFSGCKSLKTITLPDDLKEIGSSAFYNCSGITSIKLPANIEKLGSYCFSGTGIESVTIPKSIVTVEGNAFPTVKKVVFEDGLVKIPNYCLSGSTKLTSVTIPGSVTAIGYNAFYNCNVLPSITLHEGIREIGDAAFNYCKALTSVSFPSSVTKVGSNCFANTGITSVSIPKTLTTIGQGAFSSCTKIVLEDGCENIPQYCFSGASKLTEVTIPSSVKTIGYRAFYNCSSLKSITLPEVLTRIEGYTFYGCSSLTAINIPSGVTRIGSYAFENCKALEEVKIPSDTTVESYAFGYCTVLKKVVFGDNVKLCGNTFYNCKAIESIEIGENFEFSSSDFYGLVLTGSLGTLTWKVEDLADGTLEITGDGSIPDAKQTDEKPWARVDGFVNQIKITGKVDKIGKNAFYGMKNLEAVILSGEVKVIGENAFRNCPKLKYVELSSSVEEIGEGAFMDCPSIEKLVLTSENAPEIANTAFDQGLAFEIFYPFTGIGYTNYLKTRFEKIVWTDFDDTTGGQEICLVLDVSGSMSGARIEKLKEASTEFVRNIGGIANNTKISVVVYESSARVLSEASYYEGTLEKKIKSLNATGGTNYYNALNCAETLLDKSECKHKYLVMFSDGEPNDDKNRIYETADKLRKKYGIFTVGLGMSKSTDSRRNVLKRVAGSDDRYFEATDVNELIAIFRDLAKDIDREEYTKVELHRNEKWYDIKKDLVKYVVGSREDVTIKVTPSLGTRGVAKFTLGQGGNGAKLAESETGEFFVVPGKIFKENYDRNSGTIRNAQGIYVNILDAKGNILESVDINLAMTDAFRITYMKNDGTQDVVHTQLVKPWELFKYDGEEPVRKDRYFDGWYEDKQASGAYDYFSLKNRKARYTIEDDITLYAKWKTQDFDFNTDTWGFGNSPSVFATTNANDYALDDWRIFKKYTYDILDSDFQALLDYNNPSDKSTYKNQKKKHWGGSCFGMAATSVLYNRRMLATTDFNNNRPNPHSVTSDDMPTSYVDNFESLINYYYLLQYDSELHDISWDWTGYNGYTAQAENDNIEKIITKLSGTNEPALLVVYLNPTGNSKKNAATGGHAVVLYNFRSTGTDRYSMSIYDNSHPSVPYTATFEKNSSGLFECKWPSWESAWSGSPKILIGTVVRADEIVDLTAVLTSPGTVSFLSTDDGAKDVYALETSYSDFVISNGSESATIKAGKKESGSLEVVCKGSVSEVGSEPVYEFELPMLADGKTYTISSQAGCSGEFATVMRCSDDSKGFFAGIRAAKAGTVVINNQGNVDTTYSADTNQNIYVTNNKIAMPWYNLCVATTDKGVSVQNYSDKYFVKTKTANKKATIAVEGDINDVTFEDVTIPGSGVYVMQDGEKCAVKNTSDNTIASKIFGYCVIFDTQGGTKIDTLKNVEAGALVTEPAKPTKEGFIFEGWFKDKEFTTPWNFAVDTIQKDTIIYAGWSFNENLYKTVTFIMGDGSQQKLHVNKGSKITQDQCPKIPDVEQQNWYKDEDRTEKWNFSTDKVDDDITLYAEIKRYSVSFDTGIDGKTIETRSVPAGNKLKEPDTLEKEGHIFCGWYTDKKFNTKWNFEKNVVTEDLTLTAKWVENKKEKTQNQYTSISVEVLRPYSYVYTGKAITPSVIVRDGNKVLTVKKDYKISYKNNVNAAVVEENKIDDEGRQVVEANKPQVIIQGLGNYKNEQPIVTNFSIYQADMADLSISVPKTMTPAAKNKKQLAKITVKNNAKVVESKFYTVSYYTDDKLTNKVDGVTTAGTYYVVVEASGKDGVYTGNYCGKSKIFTILCADASRQVSKMKVTLGKNVKRTDEALSEEAVIRKVITKAVLGKKTYTTAGDKLAAFNELFTVAITDESGNTYTGENLYKALTKAGKVTVTIAAKADNAQGYVGEYTGKLTIKGSAIKKSMFKMSYSRSSNKSVSKAEYTGKKNLPSITSNLALGQDYVVSYMRGKKQISEDEVVDAGSYKLVITGVGKYQGKVTMPFTITKLNLANAYSLKRIKISSEGTASYSPKGSAPAFTVKFGNTVLQKGKDYSISYVNNKKASKGNKYAYAKITGKGNFTGTLIGDGKTAASSTKTLKKGKAAGLNFKVSTKNIGDSEITLVVTKTTMKKGKLKSVKFKLLQDGKVISAKEYRTRVYAYSSYGYLYVYGKGKNYTGSKSFRISNSMISVNDAKKVKITRTENTKYYYSGERYLPAVKVTDASGRDISSYVNITYGDNTKAGTGKIYISGKADKGYYGMKTVNFAILPKWMQWVF